jgi:hypothetical protein
MNVEELIEDKYSFIIPAFFLLKTIKRTILAVHASIKDPKNLKLFQDDPIFIMPISLQIGTAMLQGYAYPHRSRKQDERYLLYCGVLISLRNYAAFS